MKKLITAVLLLAIALGGIASLGSGMIDSIHAGTAVRVISGAINDKLGYFTLHQPDSTNYLFGYVRNDGTTAFVLMDAAKYQTLRGVSDQLRQLGGQIVNYSDFKSLRAALEAQGWKQIGSADIPNAIKVFFSAPANVILNARSFVFPTLLIIPTGVLKQQLQIVEVTNG